MLSTGVWVREGDVKRTTSFSAFVPIGKERRIKLNAHARWRESLLEIRFTWLVARYKPTKLVFRRFIFCPHLKNCQEEIRHFWQPTKWTDILKQQSKLVANRPALNVLQHGTTVSKPHRKTWTNASRWEDAFYFRCESCSTHDLCVEIHPPLLLITYVRTEEY